MHIEAKNGNLVITMPLTKAADARPSSSQKTLTVASSGGFVGAIGPGLPEGLKVSINASIPNPDAPA